MLKNMVKIQNLEQICNSRPNSERARLSQI